MDENQFMQFISMLESIRDELRDIDCALTNISEALEDRKLDALGDGNETEG